MSTKSKKKAVAAQGDNFTRLAEAAAVALFAEIKPYLVTAALAGATYLTEWLVTEAEKMRVKRK